MKTFTRKLTRTNSHSYYVLLPPELVREFRWRERQKLVVSKKGKEIIIRNESGPNKKTKNGSTVKRKTKNGNGRQSNEG